VRPGVVAPLLCRPIDGPDGATTQAAGLLARVHLTEPDGRTAKARYGIPSGTADIPPNTAQIQKTKSKRLYNQFRSVYRSVREWYTGRFRWLTGEFAYVTCAFFVAHRC
jgi:hypothetical protein